MTNVVRFRPRLQTRVVGIMRNELGTYRVVVIPPMNRDKIEGEFRSLEDAVALTVEIARETEWIPFDYTMQVSRGELEDMAHGYLEAL